MPNLARHLRALVVAIAVLALSATVVLGARGLPSLTVALTGSGTTASADDADAQGEDADDPGADSDAPGEDAAEDADTVADGDADQPEAAETDGADAPETGEADAPEPGDDASAHGAMVAEAAGMDTPDGFTNHGAFVSCVARQNHGHLAPDATADPGRPAHARGLCQARRGRRRRRCLGSGCGPDRQGEGQERERPRQDAEGPRPGQGSWPLIARSPSRGSLAPRRPAPERHEAGAWRRLRRSRGRRRPCRPGSKPPVAVAAADHRDGVVEPDPGDRQVLGQIRPVGLPDRVEDVRVTDDVDEILDGVGEPALGVDQRLVAMRGRTGLAGPQGGIRWLVGGLGRFGWFEVGGDVLADG